MRASVTAPVVAALFSLIPSSAFGVEFHPGYSRDNPPPSFYWHSDVPGSYNPWIDDIQMTLLEFPASNDGVSAYQGIQMLPEGYSTEYTEGPKMFTAGDTWEFVDLGTQNHLLTGTNWVHGKDYQYPENTWVLQFNGEGGFDTYRPSDHAFELGEYRGIAVEVSNLGDTYLIVDTYSKGMRQWLGKKHVGLIGLEPGDTDIIYFPFRRAEDKPPSGVADFFGHQHHLCGYPGGHLYGLVYSQMDSAHGVMGIKATVPTGVKKGNVKWTINRMWAGGRYDVPTMDRIRDAGHSEDAYEDDGSEDVYGQWKYDDWIGKLWDEQDAVDQYETLATYLSENPGPSTWNQWGGWAADDAPQLEATGWFRVEQYEGKWWFIDPDGRLFLSQGSLHMSANISQPAIDAGYTQERFSDEVYFPRLRAMGINTVGGNSSWKWHTGRIPYTYQIKTGLAPIDYTDILNIKKDGGGNGIGTVEDFNEWMVEHLSSARDYIADPYCIGVIVDNELNISEDGNTYSEPVAKIYFRAIRHALDQISQEVGRPHDPDHDPDVDPDHPEKSPIVMIDPASNGGEWMAHYCDVLAQHRMEGHYPNLHKTEWNKPVGQFAFTMGNMDVGVAHYGLTMFLNQRHRAQGAVNYMALAYSHPQNIACHLYSYMKTTARPLTEFRMLVNKSDTTDYYLAEYLGAMGDYMYRIHMGWEIPEWQSPQVPEPPDDRVIASGVEPDGTGGTDPGDPDGGNPDGASDAGCGCQAAGQPLGSGLWWLLLSAVVARSARSRRKAARSRKPHSRRAQGKLSSHWLGVRKAPRGGSMCYGRRHETPALQHVDDRPEWLGQI